MMRLLGEALRRLLGWRRVPAREEARRPERKITEVRLDPVEFALDVRSYEINGDGSTGGEI